MKLLRTVILSLTLTTVAAAPASAATGTPTDAELLGAKTVGVLPILATGASRASAFSRVGMAIADDSRGGGRAPGAVDVDLAESGGFGFAGEAGAEDVRVLRYGYYLGLMPAVIRTNNPKKTEMAAKLLASVDVIAPLGDQMRATVIKALTSLDTVDGGAFAEIFANAQRGLAEGDARKNGYLAAGMWLGLTTLALWNDGADESIIGMAEPLAVLLDEDAAFGAADRKVAAILRGVAAELRQPRLDTEKILGMTAKVLAVEAD